jgi:phenylpropionate dioxygenase-like ring-hydroxylating dioxygenase large terminal subunit
MTDILDARQRDAVGPGDAGGAAQYLLGKEAYLSPEWFAREQRDLFGRIWNLVAYESDLPAPGDQLPVQVGTDPVLLVRAADGRIRAYLNMCRHRGMALACEAGHREGNIRCPYHGWEFAPDDGTLVRIPQRVSQFDDVDPARWGLLPVPVDTWFGMVFVNPDPDAAPLAEWLGDFVDHVGPFDHTKLVDVARVRVPIACNWKLYLENHIDVLHLWYLHDETLGMYDHANFHHRKLGPHWVSDERLRPGHVRDRGGELLPISHLPYDERSVLRANMIFPNVPTSSSEQVWFTYQVVPIAPDRSELDIRIRGEAGSVLDDGTKAQFLRVLVDEDGFAVEQIQRVMPSSRFQVGPLASAHERPITDYHLELLARLGAG